MSFYKNPLTITLIAFLACIAVLAVPREAETAGSLSSATATLSNSRLSFYGVLEGAHEGGVQTIDIDTSGNADNNTNHLFPGDTIAVGPNGSMTVQSIVDGDTFTTSSGLTVGASDDDAIYGTQSGALAISFTLSSTNIPAGGYLLVTLPDPSANGNDGAPNTEAALANNGFDLNGMTTGDVATTGGTNCTWGTETLTAGSGSGHKYKITTSTQCTAGTITVTFNGASKDLINPAPHTTTPGHSQGTADYYQIAIATYDDDPDTTGVALNSVDVMVAPVEAVFVSATVDESLSFVVAGVTADSGDYCGATRTGDTPDSTPYSIPWGTISTTYTEATHNAAQQLTITTNAVSGYEVYIQESDQMGRDGNTCTGTAPSDSTDYNFSGSTCIRDTLCGGTPCTHVVAYDWGADPSTYPGLGYSLEDQTGTDAKFDYDSNASPCDKTGSGGNFCAKQLADTQGSEDPTDSGAEIMVSGGSTDASSIYVCYRIDVPGDQPAGYYYNTVKYTAVPIF